MAETFTMEKLTIVLLAAPGAPVVLQWRGEVTARDPGALLSPYLDKILLRQADSKVVLDFSYMDFMNSSTLVPIVSFIKKASKQSLAVELRYNSTVSWQRVSHQCMTVMCSKLTNIEVTYRTP